VKLATTMLLGVLLTFTACDRSEPNRVQAAAADEARSRDTMRQQREDYVKSMDATLAEFDQKFDGLDARAKAMTGKTKDNFKDAVDQLRDQRKAVNAKLDDLKKVSIDSWSSLKGEVDAAVSALGSSYDQISTTYATVPPAAPRK